MKAADLPYDWSDAAQISSSVTGGSKSNGGRMFRHILAQGSKKGARATALAPLMANPERVAQLKEGVNALNQWRRHKTLRSS
jgi:hypothetical protein